MLSCLKSSGLTIKVKYNNNPHLMPHKEYIILGGFVTESRDSSVYLIVRFPKTEEWPTFDMVSKVENGVFTSFGPDEPPYLSEEDLEIFNERDFGTKIKINQIIYTKISLSEIHRRFIGIKEIKAA